MTLLSWKDVPETMLIPEGLLRTRGSSALGSFGIKEFSSKLTTNLPLQQRERKNMMRKALSSTCISSEALALVFFFVVASIRPLSWAEPPAHQHVPVGTVHNILPFLLQQIIGIMITPHLKQNACYTYIFNKQSNRY